MVHVKPNANFRSLAGGSDPDMATEEYKEYRRCWMEYPKSFVLRDFPMHLDIEITSRCNLRCTFCDKLPNLTKEELGDMDMLLYKRIVDEGRRHGLWGVKLSYRGEPLLHKNVAEMVAYAKRKGVLDIYFNTNGMPLSEKMSVSLIDARLDRISVSVDGNDPEAFEKDRVGAKFDTILNNIDRLVEIRKKKAVQYPKVRVQTVALPGLDMDRYRDFWIRHCDEVAVIDYKDGANLKKGLIHNWACPQLWQRMTIRWNGDVSLCNNDDRCLLSPGNAEEKTLYECWHSKLAQGARSFHQKGESHMVASCDGCPWRTAQIKKMEA